MISFIIPIYNIEDELLIRCIESVLMIHQKEIELILVNDGSTTNNADICDFYANKDSRVKVSHCKNEGVSVARNIGIKNSIGSWIVFIDPDDYIDGNFFDGCFSKLDDNTDIYLFKSSFSSNSSKRKNVSKNRFEIADSATKRKLVFNTVSVSDTEYDPGSCWGKIFKSDFIRKNNLQFVPGIKKAQDRIFMFDCYIKSMKVVKIDCLAYFYNQENDMSVSRKYNPNIINILRTTSDEFHKHVKESGKFEILHYALALMTMHFIYEILQLFLLHKEYKVSFSNRRKEIIRFVHNFPHIRMIKKIKISDLPFKNALVYGLLRGNLFWVLTICGYKYLNRRERL